MANFSKITPTLPSTDIERTKNFYLNKVGLKPTDMPVPEDAVLFKVPDGSSIYFYHRGPSIADHTQVSISVDNIEAAIDELTAKGVTFEHYDMPNGIKTNDKGIAEMGGAKSAWFKDPDGNILALLQMPQA